LPDPDRSGHRWPHLVRFDDHVVPTVHTGTRLDPIRPASLPLWTIDLVDSRVAVEVGGRAWHVDQVLRQRPAEG
jgi:hypothetical protein